MAKNKEMKFQFGDCSDVFVKKVRKAFQVKICGEIEGEEYQELDSIEIPEDKVYEIGNRDEYYDLSFEEVAGRIAFKQLGYCDNLDLEY